MQVEKEALFEEEKKIHVHKVQCKAGRVENASGSV